MRRRHKRWLLRSFLLLASLGFGALGHAEPQDSQRDPPTSAAGTEEKNEQAAADALPTTPAAELQAQDGSSFAENGQDETGVSLLRNLLSDQQAIWTSPSHLRWGDGTWLFPIAAATGGFFASDRSAARAVTTDFSKFNRYTSFSNYGLASLAGAGGGLYVWGKISHNDQQTETGFLATEAAADSFAMSSVLEYSLGRERPYMDQGRGEFFGGGTSFPSDHSAVAWSIASVFAHEYPGALTQLAAYGMATAVSASRVMGEKHFPSDVVVGGVLGWLIGREVYRSHHDPELGGSAVGRLSGEEDGDRDRQNMGSPFVPLDSWVYPVFERLGALGYINTEILGLKPWTRIECARLTQEADESVESQMAGHPEAAALLTRLQEEFAYEITLLGGGRNLTANLDSVYTRAVSISGPALTDSYHFGQTISYDFGRPFERGTNGQAGGSFSAAAGPLVLYVRAEYQHAPSAPAPTEAMLDAIALHDAVPTAAVPAGPVLPINRLELLDAYIGVNVHNWELVLGRQSLSWTPGPDGSMLLSNNIEPINMARLVNPEPFHLPGLLGRFGSVRIDQFFGRLGGHPYVQRPFFYGEKINFKVSWLEIGFGRTVMIGGNGSGNPLTAHDFIYSFFGKVDPQLGSVPGHNTTELDWTFSLPKIRKYVLFYGDATASDDILPVENPARNPWHPGIYVVRIPGIPKLDFHLEGVSTEQSGLIPEVAAVVGSGNFGEFNYWNMSYRDGYTNEGNLIGNTVGREGRSIQGWFTYWISPRDIVRLAYSHNTVSADFVPGGGAWQNYSLQSETYLRGGFYIKADLQYENISWYPILFSGPERNFVAVLEIGFYPKEQSRAKN
jgi:membrane-associated phospholipid phosphatase